MNGYTRQMYRELIKNCQHLLKSGIVIYRNLFTLFPENRDRL
jgi:hypothetical protein